MSALERNEGPLRVGYSGARPNCELTGDLPFFSLQILIDGRSEWDGFYRKMC
jgi:hypothetical protein